MESLCADALEMNYGLEKRDRMVESAFSDESGRHLATRPHWGPRRSFCFGR